MYIVRILGLMLLVKMNLADLKVKHKARDWKHTSADEGAGKYNLPDDLDFDFEYETDFRISDKIHKPSKPLLQENEFKSAKDDSVYLPAEMQVKEVTVKNLPDCDPDIISMYFTVPLPRSYSPFIWNKEVEHVCPTLEHTCCESHELLERHKEFKASYLDLTRYRLFEKIVQKITPKNEKSEAEIEALLLELHLTTKSHAVSVTAAATVVAEINQATPGPSPPMRMARM